MTKTVWSEVMAAAVVLHLQNRFGWVAGGDELKKIFRRIHRESGITEGKNAYADFTLGLSFFEGNLHEALMVIAHEAGHNILDAGFDFGAGRIDERYDTVELTYHEFISDLISY